MSDKKKIIVYGAMWCPDTLRALEYFSKHAIDYEFKDIEKEENVKYVEEVNNGLRVIPTILLPSGVILTEPSNSELDKNFVK